MFKSLYHYFIIHRSGLFDRAYYLHHYPDVRRADIDALMHFIRTGWRENRNPSELFNTTYYLDSYPDVKNANLNPLIHYIKFGRSEGRDTSPPANPQQRRRKQSIQFMNLDRSFVSGKDIEVSGKIAVHIHIFYETLIDEFVSYIEQMPLSYDLFISTTNEKTLEQCQNKFHDLPFLENLNIKQVPNRGRDMAPFFCTFGEEIRHYDYIAHLHSKQSLYNQGATQGWREYLCGTLIGNPNNIKTIIGILQEEHQIGLIYPQTYNRVPYFAHTWLSNKHLGRIWCHRLGITDLPMDYFDFPVGSMFWATGEALAPLFEAGIELEDFEVEKGQTDGTLAHCLERLIGLCASKQGFEHGIIKDTVNPSWSAWRFDQYFTKSLENMNKRFQSPDIKLIGFDIFDTLLIRPLLNPESIKAIVAARIGPDLGQQYLDLRPCAEAHARQQKKADVDLDEIYQEMTKFSILSERDLKQIKLFEEEIELNIANPRYDGVMLYKEALTTGKPVILISDTFLKKDFLKELLKKNDITGFDALFTSSDIGMRKDSGKLYDVILEKYPVSPKNFLMIGDNEHSDLQIPMKKGFSTLHLMKPVEIAHGLPRFRNLISNNSINNDINAEITLGLAIQKKFPKIDYQKAKTYGRDTFSPFEIGYVYNGPFLLSFSQWLIDQCRKDRIDHLYFLSREGKIIKKVYDVWKSANIDAPKSSYLELSRRAISVASVETLEDIYKIARTTYFKNKLGKFFKTRFGLEINNEVWKIINNDFGFSEESEIEVLDKNISHLKPLLNFLFTYISNRAQYERPALTQYLREKGLYQEERMAVVDIGFGGTIQGYLNKILKKKIHGYYLMTAGHSLEIAEKHDVLIKGCFGERLTRTPDAPILFRRSFSIEKLLSCNDPQIKHFSISEDNQLIKNHRELTNEEIKPFSIRDQIHQGTIEYAKDAVEIKKKIYPQFFPSFEVAKSLYESLIGDYNQDEKEILNKIVLDDYYCGRDLVY